mmetsp:Transcript_27124/g.33695  ORF Transcript_27124/g.33695 Transcript_27124/m.33695 type:complete len:97 (-) Transcript_27124:328-618(-)
MYKTAQAMVAFAYNYRTTIIGFAGCYFMSRRMTLNIEDLEKNAAEKKLFDPVKAKAQMEVYKEIYRLEEQEGLSEDQKKDIRNRDGALKILQTASD